jgi:hypothetical protein
MARVSLVQTATQGPKNFYNVDAAVGRGAANRRDDVLLVQYMLRENFKLLNTFKRDPFPGGPVEVDGSAGPQTLAAILHFQKTLKKGGSSIATDGRVDPPVNEGTVGSISNTQYTILFLNLGFKDARPQDFPRLSQATDCPVEIRQRLREPTFV